MFKGLVILVLVITLPIWAEEASYSQQSNENRVILVVGDSLSSAYGIEINTGWVALLQARLSTCGCDYKVINASVTGDTTAGGLARLKKALSRYQPSLVVVELGGNDGLRGIPLSVVEKNLASMIELSTTAGANVALLGIRIPMNYGQRYADQFHALYKKLADHYKLPLTDFFMEGVALTPALMQADGVHPNVDAQPRLLANALPTITRALGNRCQLD